LKNYQGSVQKSATVYSNDRRNPRITLVVKGKIKTLIGLSPGNTVFFKGMADQSGEKSIEMVSNTKPFHITELESDLGEKIAYRVEAVEDGKRYRLVIKNQVKEGTYRGFIKAHTDLAEKPEILIRVTGHIEGEIVVRPQTIVIGRLAPGQPVRSGKVLVISNLNKPFKITRMSYDKALLDVSRQPLPDDNTSGFSIEIAPKMSNEDTTKEGNSRQALDLIIETDADPEEKHEVKIYLVAS
jgi:hypothetical protein